MIKKNRNRKPETRRHIVLALHDPRTDMLPKKVVQPHGFRTIYVESLQRSRDDCTEIVRGP